jgi:hypothetical protein
MDNKNKNNVMEMGSDPSENTSHPVGKGIGGLAGAAAGAAAGSAAGPIGTVAGGTIGAIAGWLEGKTIAEGINPDVEVTYWRKNYPNSSYYNKDRDWNDYERAYMFGIYSYNPDSEFEDVEGDLSRDWDKYKGKSRLNWKEASRASRDAYEKLSKDN